MNWPWRSSVVWRLKAENVFCCKRDECRTAKRGTQEVGTTDELGFTQMRQEVFGVHWRSSVVSFVTSFMCSEDGCTVRRQCEERAFAGINRFATINGRTAAKHRGTTRCTCVGRRTFPC